MPLLKTASRNEVLSVALRVRLEDLNLGLEGVVVESDAELAVG